jgi:dCTP deaminase
MSVIPLVKTGDHRTVVSTKDDFTHAGSFNGTALLISNLDDAQLRPDDRESHLTYDLRVGQEYKDHRDRQKQGLPDDGEITLLPGVAVILLTEESVCLPRSMFAYIIPRVSILQKGISNIVSKIDPGYDGPLVITVFNLGKKTVTLKRRERFCCLVVHHVLEGAALYDKPAQLISGEPKKRGIHRALDWVQANAGLMSILAGFLAVRSQIFDLIKGLVSLLERITKHL